MQLMPRLSWTYKIFWPLIYYFNTASDPIMMPAKYLVVEIVLPYANIQLKNVFEYLGGSLK